MLVTKGLKYDFKKRITEAKNSEIKPQKSSKSLNSTISPLNGFA